MYNSFLKNGSLRLIPRFFKLKMTTFHKMQIKSKQHFSKLYQKWKFKYETWTALTCAALAV